MASRRVDLDRIAQPVADEVALLDDSFRSLLGTDVPLVGQVFDRLIEGGGKRIRPLLVLLGTSLLAEGAFPAGPRKSPSRREKVFRLAAAVEFIHTASLLHDDVVDKSDVRRGKVAAHRTWGVEAAILCGDYLFSRAFSLLVENRDLSLLSVVSSATTGLARGEVLQLLRSYSTGTTEQEYLEVIEGKTARLISSCTEGAACLAGAAGGQRTALARFGLQVGLAFQVADDLLDYTATQQAMGKRRGQDFFEGKVTLPAIYLMESLSPAGRAEVRKAFLKEEADEGDLARVLAMMEEKGAFERARRTARELAERAESELAAFPETPSRKSLADLADFVVLREA